MSKRGAKRSTIILLAALASRAITSPAQAGSSILGYWREPEGSVIRVERCGADLCLRLAAISRTAPARVDGHNPNPALRNRALCGLIIGTGFHTNTATQAEGGKLYDPKSGKTYSGSMAASGDHLDLRGYVGIKMFGRSETWTRADTAPVACDAAAKD
jgi:uncharacterized protein (DUF2147 family)